MIFTAIYLSIGVVIAVFALWQCRGELVRWDIGAGAVIIFIWPIALLILIVAYLTDEAKSSKLKA